MMIITTYRTAGEFLLKNQTMLEANEVVNGLMLGICSRLERFPERIKATPYLASVEDEQGLAFAAVMTPPHKIVIYGNRQKLVQPIALVVQDLFDNRRQVPGVLGPSNAAGEFAVAWAKQAGIQCTEGVRQRVYELRKVVHPEPIPGKLRPATEEDLELITNWIFHFAQDVGQDASISAARERVQIGIKDQEFFIWEDGQPVSMAAKVRPTSHGIAVSLVYTPPELRRRGYATACVAALSQLLLDSGWQFCSLFTDLSNPTSNSVYQKIGYKPVCDFSEYIFT